MNRDPLKEFFTLTLQSVKLNSPHMNIICMLNKDELYDKAIKEGVPFFQWQIWIEKLINKEVLSKIIKKVTNTNTNSTTTTQPGSKIVKQPQSNAKEALLKMQAEAKTKKDAGGAAVKKPAATVRPVLMFGQ